MKSNRRLAAIMFTDIVGYTLLMGTDEEAALRLLGWNRAIHKSLIKTWNGEWLKEMGDGTLACFNSSSEAVRCAGALQQKAISNGISLRIGIHMGEVVFNEKDVFGDGVNIASRIEALAPTDGIWISESVHENVLNKRGIESTFVREVHLKNVMAPVRIYNVKVESVSIPDSVILAKKNHLKVLFTMIGVLTIFALIYLVNRYFLRAPEVDGQITKNSIAVLPFDDTSPDSDQEYFCIGMMDEILNHLYKIGDLRIPSRTSSMQYKRKKDQTIEGIGAELGVAYVLDGSIRKHEQHIRMNVQLTDVATDNIIWTDAYDGEYDENLLLFQSETAKQVARELRLELSPQLRQQMTSFPTQNLEAYDAFLRAKFLLGTWAGHGRQVRDILQNVVALDPQFASAYGLLGFSWMNEGGFAGNLARDSVINMSFPLLEQALSLNKNDALTHLYLACYYLWYHWDFEKAEQEWDFVNSLRPSGFDYWHLYVAFLNASGQHNRALEFIERMLEIDRTSISRVSVKLTKARTQLYLGQIENASESIRSIDISQLPSNTASSVLEFFLYLRQYEQIIGFLNIRADFPRYLRTAAITYYHTDQASECEKIINDIKELAQKTSAGSPSYYLSQIYAQKGEPDLSFYWLQKAYQDHEVEMYWLETEPLFEPLKTDTRWREMLEEVGFKG